MLQPAIREELLALTKADQKLREELASDGSLFNSGYHPHMEELHRRHATRLKQIIQQHGWPGKLLVGEDGAEAAWMIAQHAISDPSFMRLALSLVEQAAASGDAPLWQVAFLQDRIRMFEGKNQIYGTQFDWDENAELSPYPPLEDPDNVDDLRSKMGLCPLYQEILRKRREVSSEQPPANLRERREEMRRWAVSVGWRK